MSDEIMDDQVNEEAVEDTTEDQLKGDEPHSEEHDVSEEELDEIADTAIAALKGILEHFDVGEVTIDEYEGDEGELILDITGDNLAILIGRHGKTLDALQFIISAITTRTMGFRYPVIVDVEGYKNRQRQKVRVCGILRRSTREVAASQREAAPHDALRAPSGSSRPAQRAWR